MLVAIAHSNFPEVYIVIYSSHQAIAIHQFILEVKFLERNHAVYLKKWSQQLLSFIFTLSDTFCSVSTIAHTASYNNPEALEGLKFIS